jgi:CDP-diacylglycerol pyrophosphatase
MTRAILATIAVVGLLAAVSAPPPSNAHHNPLSGLMDKTSAAHPNALWHIVHELCVPDMQARGHPAPCAVVNLAGGYAVLKDIQGPTQYLVIPTARVTGIESPALLAQTSPNYWQAAWSSRQLFEQSAGRAVPRQDIGLAINSALGRTQNQLHIHIDCVQPSVRDALSQHLGKISVRWSTLAVGPRQHRYRVRWLADAELATQDPFKLLARDDRLARADMGRETMALIGAVRPDGATGFVLLSDRADIPSGDVGAAEELLDHKCVALTR